MPQNEPSRLIEFLDGKEVRSWAANLREAAEAEGRGKGRIEGRIEGRTEILLNMVRHKFGEESAAEMESVLSRVRSAGALDKVAVLLLSCETGNALLARVREF